MKLMLIVGHILQLESVNCFWAQLFDELNKNKLLKIWDVINEMENLTIAKPKNLKIGDVYIVDFNKEKYRATFISVICGPQKKYKVFLFILLLLKNIFDT